jgi:aquaporin Z
MHRYVAEAIGTFCLVFAGCGAIVINQVTGGSIGHVGVALSFGLVVMAMIYAVGDISGAHLNPAVTLGFVLAKRLARREAGLFVISQVIGAVVASAALRLLFVDHPDLGATVPAGADSGYGVFRALLLEVLITAMLVYVILSVASGAKEKGMMAGIAVGGTIGLAALFAGPISGASMNPARSLGPAVVSLQFTALWVYIVGPILGACLAIPACRCTHQAQGCCRKMERGGC